MSNEVAVKNKTNIFSCFIKGIFVSLITTLIGIFLFALILKFVNLGDTIIKIVNQIIKILSVLFGVKICLKGNKTKGLLKGIVVGVLYTVFSYFIFSILVSNFAFGLNFLYDILFLGLAGLVCGVIFVNGKK
ncbi:MAG: TIGR04086 family membrane protein [Clostridia bacterium]|nr:TIGR04086 family membrane protein [Clostridia bacterium]